MEHTLDEALLEESLAKVEQARNWSPRLVSRLESTIRSGSDEDLFRLNPVQWAQTRHVDENEAIDLFLHSAKAGLFYMDWNIICPCCGKVMRSLRNLHGLRSRNVCTVCFRDDQATLDDYVQVTFTLSTAVRNLKYHSPETLTLEEYCFKYLFAGGGKYGPGGDMALVDFLKIAQQHFSTFSPGEKISIELEVRPGLLFCSDLFSQKGFAFIVDGAPAAQTQSVPVKLSDAQFEVPLPEIQPGEYRVAHKYMSSDFFYPLHTGKVVLELEQCSAFKAGLIVWYADRQSIAGFPDITFQPCLSAKRLFACQTFHELFPSEVFQESQGFGVKDVSILFTDLQSSTQLYNRIGDLNAYALVRAHYGVLSKAILNQHGAVVKTIGDAIMAAFTQPQEAVAAALEMLQELGQLNRTSQYGELVLKVGIHRGAAISVTLNGRLDYFGQTINIASRVQGMAGGDEIFLTGDVYAAPGVQELLEQYQYQAESMQMQLKGIAEPVKTYRVSALQEVAAAAPG